MSEQQMAKPVVNVVIAINSSLSRIVDMADSLHVAVRGSVAQGSAEVLNVLGIPGMPEVEIQPIDEDSSADDLVHIAVNGKPCRYPNEFLSVVYCYQNGTPLRWIEPTAILEFLSSACATSSESNDTARKEVTEFFRLASLAIIESQPHLLLGPAQVAAYRDDLLAVIQPEEPQTYGWPPDTAFVAEILGNLLRMRRSIVDQTTIATLLLDGHYVGREPDDIVEDLAVAVQPRVVEIHLPRDYLREITLAETESAYDKFAKLRDGLFHELGVFYPDFRFVVVENLKPSSFRFQLGPVATLARRGLRSNELLVNDSGERLDSINIRGEPAINPADGTLCSIIKSELRRIAENAGLTTWNPIDYVVLSLASELRSESWRFVTSDFVEGQLASFGQAFPALTKAVHRRFTTVQITKTLRSLIAEEISIRNLRSVLELLLHSDYIVADASKYTIFDDRLPLSKPPQDSWQKNIGNLTAAVRFGLKREISHKYMRGGTTLVVYLIDAEIEKAISDRPAPVVGVEVKRFPDENEVESILKAVREQLRMVSPGSQTPAILTTIEVRSILRDLLSYEFPRVPVIAYEELSPDMNIQPMARISFGRLEA